MSKSAHNLKPALARQIVFRELRKRALFLAAIGALMLGSAALGLVQPLLYRELLDSAIPAKDVKLVFWLLVGMVAIPLLTLGLTYFQEYLRGYIGETVSQALRTATFDKILHSKMEDIERFTSGEIVDRITRQCGRVGEMYVAQELLPVATSVVVLLGTAAVMFYMNWSLALISLFVFPPSYAISRYLARHSKSLESEFTELLEDGEGFVIETVRGLRTIRAFGGEKREHQYWDRWVKKHLNVKAKTLAMHDILMHFPHDVINGLGLGVVFGFGAYEIIKGQLSIGSLVAFVAYTPRLYASLHSIMRGHIGTQRIKPATEKLDEILTLDTEPDHDEGIPLPITKERGVSVEFDDVTFHYRRGFGVKNITFDVEPGEFIGIVGPTGGGKSTIFDLLMGFYTPESGSIRVNGVDTRQLSLASLRQNIGSVPQHVFLWNTTIRRNIIYPQDDVPQNDLTRVAYLADVNEFVSEQPERFETVVGEHGATLSGGERQRIAIARAMLKEPRILLMDEGTAALDALTEARIRDLLDRASAGRTTIVIAHRIASVFHADRILVIDEGRIVEQGTPRELIAFRGLFFDLFQAQALSLET